MTIPFFKFLFIIEKSVCNKHPAPPPRPPCSQRPRHLDEGAVVHETFTKPQSAVSLKCVVENCCIYFSACSLRGRQNVVGEASEIYILATVIVKHLQKHVDVAFSRGNIIIHQYWERKMHSVCFVSLLLSLRVLMLCASAHTQDEPSQTIHYCIYIYRYIQMDIYLLFLGTIVLCSSVVKFPLWQIIFAHKPFLIVI